MKINKTLMVGIMGVFILICISFISIYSLNKKSSTKTKKIEATVLAVSERSVTVQDKSNIIYTFSLNNVKADIGDSILIEYTGLLDKNKVVQKNNIINYTTSTVSMD